MNPAFVVDASVIVAWNDPRDDNNYANMTLDCLKKETAITPPLCCLEVNNVLRLFEKKGYITGLDLERTISFIDRLPIIRDSTPTSFTMPITLRLARENNLTIYDACYLELAARFNLPLATLDNDLIKAVKASGLPLKTGE